VLKVADELGVTVLITADHGNADEMLEKNKKGELQVRTAHSLNPVPFIIYSKNEYAIKDGSYGLANVAPTVAKIFGLKPYDSWLDSMI
jgi:2,3-bisphosphoglycerate-independent phosphoglycerate mutase